MRCIVIRGDAWLVLLSPCNTYTCPKFQFLKAVNVNARQLHLGHFTGIETEFTVWPGTHFFQAHTSFCRGSALIRQMASLLTRRSGSHLHAALTLCKCGLIRSSALRLHPEEGQTRRYGPMADVSTATVIMSLYAFFFS